mgnify:CR=1 FL=1
MGREEPQPRKPDYTTKPNAYGVNVARPNVPKQPKPARPKQRSEKGA